MYFFISRVRKGDLNYLQWILTLFDSFSPNIKEGGEAFPSFWCSLTSAIVSRKVSAIFIHHNKNFFFNFF
jgi:hypothetical protein